MPGEILTPKSRRDEPISEMERKSQKGGRKAERRCGHGSQAKCRLQEASMVNTVDCWEEIQARTQNAHVIN